MWCGALTHITNYPRSQRLIIARQRHVPYTFRFDENEGFLWLLAKASENAFTLIEVYNHYLRMRREMCNNYILHIFLQIS